MTTPRSQLSQLCGEGMTRNDTTYGMFYFNLIQFNTMTLKEGISAQNLSVMSNRPSHNFKAKFVLPSEIFQREEKFNST